MAEIKSICVFCASSPGTRPEYRAATEAFAGELAARGITIVYGGGNVGLMGALADAALAAGGKVVGVIPGHLMAREIGHKGLTKLHVVDSMHARKALMADLSDAFIALPGGFGYVKLSKYMEQFSILNTRKRAIIALIHSVFFLAIATRGLIGAPSTASLLWNRTAGVMIGGVVYVIVTSVLVWLLAISGPVIEKMYFAFCATSAGTGLLRMLVGESRLPGGALIRVSMLTLGVLTCITIARRHSEQTSA